MPESRDEHACAPDAAVEIDAGAPDPFLIVGIGASAGGLEALRGFLGAVGPSPGMAYVVIQHLDPTHRSRLPELLASHIDLPVEQVERSVRISPDHVYIIPPDRWLTVADGVLELQQMQRERTPRMSIDHFFKTLAEDSGHWAVGIVLSGTGTDGTEGLRAIKGRGGLALAQDPSGCTHEGMPRSAIAAGVVDRIMRVEDMPGLLADYAQHPYLLESDDAPEGRESDDGSPLTATGVQGILEFLEAERDFNFSSYKPATLWRRIQRRIGLTGTGEVDGYLELLQSDPAEIERLSKDLLIGVTEFFRDPDAYAAVQDLVLPGLFEGKESGGSVRAWVPACATGEEAYSIAMLLLEHRSKHDLDVKVQVFASDLDEDALVTARAGVYPVSATVDFPEERVERFFNVTDDSDRHLRVSRELRESVVFAKQNLIGDPPFSKMDFISCRNLLIYLQSDVQRQLVQLFHVALRRGGFLFLGTSETIGPRQDLFKVLSKTWRVYRRIGGHETVALWSGFGASFHFDRPGETPGKTARPASSDGSELDRIVCDFVLNEFSPATVVINRNQQAIYLRGPTAQFLQLPAGDVTNDLQRMLRPGLTSRVHTVVRKALREKRRVELEARMDQSDGAHALVLVTGEPIESEEHGEIVLLTFQSRGTTALPIDGASVDAAEQSVLRQLEEELDATREDLQTTIEELETSNEELRSANEELQSSNEELESSTEELQSLNEELTTVNNQLEVKIDEVERAHDDMRNFLASTHLATVFLDTSFCVKRFTPQATKLMNLIPADVGRPLRQFSHPLIDDGLLDDAAAVLDDLQPAEAQVRAHDEWYIRRVLPYRTEDNRIEGVVVSFTDITALRKATTELHVRAAQQSAAATLGLNALQARDLQQFMDLVVRTVADTLDAEYCKILELLPGGDELLLRAGVGWREGLVGTATVSAGLESQAGYTLKVTEPVLVDDLPEERRFSGPPLLFEHDVVSGISCVIGSVERPFGVIGVHSRSRRKFTSEDATFLQSVANVVATAGSRRRAEQWLAESEHRLALAIESGGMAAWEWDLRSNSVHWHPHLYTLLGLDPETTEPSAKLFFELVHPDDQHALRTAIERTATTQTPYDAEFRVVRNDREVRWLAGKGRPICDRNGKTTRIIGVNFDITDRREANQLAAAHHEVSRQLTEMRSLEEAAPDILRVFCEAIDADICEVWQMRDGGIVCTAQHFAEWIEPDAWREATDGLTFAPGEGFPGRVWESGQPDWIDDVSTDATVRRRAAAEQVGLCTGLAFPVMSGADCRGIIVFFSRGCRIVQPSMLQRLMAIGRDIAALVDRARSAWQREMLLQELNHRVKNTLAVVQAIAAQTMRYSPSMDEFQEAFESRLRSLGRTHSLLTRQQWIGTGLGDLVEAALAPFESASGSVRVRGEPVTVRATCALALSLVLHEMATNAAKHGALSTDGGRVSVSWEFVDDELAISWVERGGPVVGAPAKTGFGSSLIPRVIEHELDGTVETTIEPEGFSYDIRVPLAKIRPHAQQGAGGM